MTRTALLNNVDHGALRVAIGQGAAFGDAVNQMLLVPTEFLDAQRDYPILFRHDDEAGWGAVALLGFDQNENLFLGVDGWQDHYIPAVQRRGPFIIGIEAGDHDDPKIRIALDDPRVGAPDGRSLFLPQGGEAPYLVQVRDALATLHAGVAAVVPMFAAFDAAGLLMPVRLDIEVDEAGKYRIEDYWTIDIGRLATLDGETLVRLNAAGHLALAFAVVASLGTIQRLIARKRALRCC